MSKPANIKTLTPNKTYHTLAITCYQEQLATSEQDLFTRIKSSDSSEYHIIAIKHDKSSEKEHYHILVRVTAGSKKVSETLRMLGINFRSGLDDKLMKNRGLETCGSFPSYAVYLLHKTPDAIQEGKAGYEKEDFVTNLSNAELDMVLDGYSITKKPLSKAGLLNIMDKARIAGTELKNFQEFIESFKIQGLSDKQRKEFRNAYVSGVKDLMSTDPRLNRIILEIEYPKNCGPNEQNRINNAISHAMSNLNCCITDAFPVVIDELTQALIVFHGDEMGYEYLGQLSTNRIEEINKPIVSRKSTWAGQYLIYTHGYYAREYIATIHSKDGIKQVKKPCPYRFNHNSLLCTIQNNELICIEQPDTYYSDDQRDFIISEFKRIRDAINKYLKEEQADNYRPISLEDLNS